MTNVCRDFARAAILASLPALLLFSACSSGAQPQATPSVSALDSATPAASAAAPSAATDNAGGAGSSTPTPAAASSPAPSTPAAPAGTPAPAGPTPTPLAATDSTPCKAFQIKGDSTTHNFYLPGQPEYPGLRANVQCFNTIDDAKGAGFHLPGQG